MVGVHQDEGPDSPQQNGELLDRLRNDVALLKDTEVVGLFRMIQRKAGLT